MLTEEVLQNLKEVVGSNGRYMAKCPCHMDSRPSLAITAKDGITLIYCFAGCEAIRILAAVGLTFEDLRDSRNKEAKMD